MTWTNQDDIWHTVTSGTPERRAERFGMAPSLVKIHVVTLKDVIDAQASGNEVRGYAALRAAADHMAMIADPLADAIIKQFGSVPFSMKARARGRIGLTIAPTP